MDLRQWISVFTTILITLIPMPLWADNLGSLGIFFIGLFAVIALIVAVVGIALAAMVISALRAKEARESSGTKQGTEKRRPGWGESIVVGIASGIAWAVCFSIVGWAFSDANDLGGILMFAICTGAGAPIGFTVAVMVARHAGLGSAWMGLSSGVLVASIAGVVGDVLSRGGIVGIALGVGPGGLMGYLIGVFAMKIWGIHRVGSFLLSTAVFAGGGVLVGLSQGRSRWMVALAIPALGIAVSSAVLRWMNWKSLLAASIAAVGCALAGLLATIFAGGELFPALLVFGMAGFAAPLLSIYFFRSSGYSLGERIAIHIGAVVLTIAVAALGGWCAEDLSIPEWQAVVIFGLVSWFAGLAAARYAVRKWRKRA
jgi:hypothetical protein